MRICIVNQSKKPDAEVQTAIMAVNAQLSSLLTEWSTLAHLRLEGKRYSRKMSLKELRGDALLYISDDADESALGWHDADKFGVPYGVIYTGYDFEPWTVTLSHEVLELAMDAHCNRLCMGPHPTDRDRDVFHWMELCDAVQGDHYSIGGVEVSDFVLPAYFTPTEEKGMRMSFLGADIPSFGVAEGGYVGFFDPESGQHETFARGAQAEVAAAAKKAGRQARYRRCGRAA